MIKAKLVARRVSVVAIVLLFACAAREPTLQMGPEAEVSYDGLHRVDHVRFQRVWARPGLSLAGYSKLLPVDGDIRYRRAPSRARREFPLSDRQREQLREDLRQVFDEALTAPDGWEIVDASGPDVLLVRAALVDLVVRVPPEAAGGRASTFLASVGEATLMVEIFDSESHEILARMADRRAAAVRSGGRVQSTPVSNRAAVRDVFRAWARRLREALDVARTIELPAG